MELQTAICAQVLPTLLCFCVCHDHMGVLKSLRVCHSSSIVGKQQDGAMDSSQTRGNVRAWLRAAEELVGRRERGGNGEGPPTAKEETAPKDR